MSDVKIQTTAPDELAGGQTLKPERTGAEYPVNFPLSGRSGTEVEASSGNNGRAVSPGLVNGVVPANRPADLNSGLCVSGRAQEAAKRVDQVDVNDFQRHAPADKLGDVARGSLDKAADNGGPRKAVGQFKGSKFEQSGGFQSFPGDTADSDAGN